MYFGGKINKNGGIYYLLQQASFTKVRANKSQIRGLSVFVLSLSLYLVSRPSHKVAIIRYNI